MIEPSLRAFGADRIEPGEGEEIVLRCPESKAWTARTVRTSVRAEHPGTAVAWGDRIFEVRAAEPLPEGGMRYRLSPWPESHAIRRFERYDEESERSRSRAHDDLRAGLSKRRLSILLAPLAGLLPGAVQKRMESEFGAPSLAMTVTSALPLLVVGFLGLFNHILGMAGGNLGWPAWLVPPLPVALFLFGESALRLASAVAGLEPMGLIVVELVYATRRHAGRDEDRALAPSASKQDLQDRYTTLEPLLALLSPSEQRYLRDHFRFDAVRWGRITSAVLLLVGVGNSLAAVSDLASTHGGLSSVLGILVGGLLAAEQIHRLRRLGRREPAGSVLGWLVGPLARPLFGVEARSDPSGPR